MVKIYECLQSTQPQKKTTTKPVKHEHATKASGTYVGDKFVCSNVKDIKKWLECAKKGECNGLSYTPAYTTKNFWGTEKRHSAVYIYKTKQGDTPQTVRAMFNLKPGALRKYDEYIFDINEPYQGKTIKFDEDDIMP